MKASLISVSSLTPHFSLTEPITDPTSKVSLLLGQERLLNAFKLAQSIERQYLYIADYPSINRDYLFQALTDNSIQEEYLYLSGPIRRRDLIGFKDADSKLWQHGALAQSKTVFICASSLYEKERLWNLLFHVLETGRIETANGQSLPLCAKIILIGSSELYAGVRYQDFRFNQYFPLLAELSYEIDINQYEISDYCQWLTSLATLTGATLNLNSYQSLLSYSAKLTEHQQRLSLMMNDFSQLMEQAKVYSESEAIDQQGIEKALEQKAYRHNSSEIYSAQSFDDKFINLATQGEAVGQINALTVIDSIDFCYGEPARITTSVHYGDGEVADIERKSELGGNIHAKGLMILTSCLYRIFGKDEPLHLNANIVFEQSYQEIDGDSASLAEYCCLISAIAEKPILQSMAITGALDQLGNVQAIGGVNEKIEGFYNLCARRGLTGTQGVIIPQTNLLQLNLPKAIIKAVETKTFHIHQVSHMDEAVELLMQMPAGTADEHNNFPDNSLYGIVQQRLDKLAGNLDEEFSFFEKLKLKLGLSI